MLGLPVRFQSAMGGEAQRQENEAATYMAPTVRRGRSTDARLTFSVGFGEGQQPMGWSAHTSLRPLQIAYTRCVPPECAF